MTEKKQGRGPHLRYAAFVGSLIAAGGLTAACDLPPDAPDAQYGGVCVSHVTGMRVDDDQCGDWDATGFYDGGPTGNYMVWYPITSTYDVPAVGQRLTGTPPLRVASGTPIAKGVPTAGASAKAGGMAAIQRGGFGIKSGTSGGTGGKAAAGARGGSGGS